MRSRVRRAGCCRALPGRFGAPARAPAAQWVRGEPQSKRYVASRDPERRGELPPRPREKPAVLTPPGSRSKFQDPRPPRRRTGRASGSRLRTRRVRGSPSDASTASHTHPRSCSTVAGGVAQSRPRAAGGGGRYSRGVAGLLQVRAGSSMAAGLGPPRLRTPGHLPQRGAWTAGCGRRGRRAGRAARSGRAAAPRGSAARTAAQREPRTHRQEAGARRRLTGRRQGQPGLSRASAAAATRGLGRQPISGARGGAGGGGAGRVRGERACAGAGGPAGRFLPREHLRRAGGTRGGAGRTGGGGRGSARGAGTRALPGPFPAAQCGVGAAVLDPQVRLQVLPESVRLLSPA
ncbi:uncharacterized protein LOC144579974 [Callithrix jacchus]